MLAQARFQVRQGVLSLLNIPLRLYRPDNILAGKELRVLYEMLQ
jgi:hypothetical protein